MPPHVSTASFGPRDAEPLEGFAGDAKSILEGLFGKTDPKDIPPFARAAIEANERVRAIAARKFADDDGRELLEALCDSVLRRPFFIVHPKVTLEQTALMGAMREGQAATVYLLLAWIAEGRREQPPQREGNVNAPTKRVSRKYKRARR